MAAAEKLIVSITCPPLPGAFQIKMERAGFSWSDLPHPKLAPDFNNLLLNVANWGCKPYIDILSVRCSHFQS